MLQKESYRYFRLLLILILCLAVGQFIFAPRMTFAQDNNKDLATQVLTLVNNWRVQEGLWPLKVNPTLETMALAQAKYVLPKLDTIAASDDETLYHKDDQGRMPQQRAAQTYNWPTYGTTLQIEVGENAGVGHDSAIHKKAALSPVYREVGIAVVQIKTDYLFIMDMGARPGVLPAYVNDAGDTLYPTDERSKYASVKIDGTQVRVFDAQGKALTKSTPWAQSISLPKGLEGSIFVLFTNGSFQAMTQVTLPSSNVIPPTNTPKGITATPEEPTPSSGQADAQPTAVVAVPTATSTPKPSGQAATVVLIYDQHSLVVYNNAGKKINLSRFSVGSGIGKVGIESWSKVAPVPVGVFPAANCLQIAINGVDASVPSVCKAVRAQVIMNPANAFWKQGTFDVKIGTTVLVTCKADDGRCEVDWSQDKG